MKQDKGAVRVFRAALFVFDTLEGSFCPESVFRPGSGRIFDAAVEHDVVI